MDPGSKLGSSPARSSSSAQYDWPMEISKHKMWGACVETAKLSKREADNWNIVTSRFDNLALYVQSGRVYCSEIFNHHAFLILSPSFLFFDKRFPPFRSFPKLYNLLPIMTGSSSTSAATSYKQLKEDFVSNLSGGSVSEIAQVCAVAPVCSETTSDRANTKPIYAPTNSRFPPNADQVHATPCR